MARSPRHHGTLSWKRALAVPIWLIALSGIASAQVAPPSVTALRFWQAGLQAPARIATDLTGRVYISDSAAGRVIVRDEYGRVIGSPGGINRPLGIAVDLAGFAYVGEEATGSVLVLDPGWNFVRKLGAGNGEFLLPNHIAIDPDPSSLVYVADSGANAVKVYEPGGALVRVIGGPGSYDGQFRFPTGVFVTSAGEVFVADQDNNRVQVFNREGTFLRKIRLTSGMMGTGGGRIQGLTVDLLGRIYVADAFQATVRVHAPDGVKLASIGTLGSAVGELRNPSSLVIDRNSRLFVVSVGNGRVELYGLDGYVDPAILPATVMLRPATLKRDDSDPDEDDERPTVTGLVKVDSFAPGDIIVSSIRANGVPAIPVAGTAIGDFDQDGFLELRFRIDRAALLATLPDGEAIVTVTGAVAGGLEFEGAAPVRVIPDDHKGTGEGPPGGTTAAPAWGGV